MHGDCRLSERGEPNQASEPPARDRAVRPKLTCPEGKGFANSLDQPQ
jgi:hypothetical protein